MSDFRTKLFFAVLLGFCLLSVYCKIQWYTEMKVRLAAAEEAVRVLQKSSEETNRILLKQNALENDIRSMRHATNRKLEAAVDAAGAVSTDDLLRMLEEDAAARRDRAANGTYGPVPGAAKQLPGTGTD